MSCNYFQNVYYLTEYTTGKAGAGYGGEKQQFHEKNAGIEKQVPGDEQRIHHEFIYQPP